MGHIIFITGGARSGKSAYALHVGGQISNLSPYGRKAFIATAEAFDEEMKERITLHKKARPSEWETIEEPVTLREKLHKIEGLYDVVLVDCLTLWLSNILSSYGDRFEICPHIVKGKIEDLTTALKTISYKVIIISNEVGQGIVPENKTARLFRDLSGWMNQKVASVADEVYLVTCGIPVKIK